MSIVVLGQPYQRLLDNALRSLELETVYLPVNPDVDARLCGHADLSMFPEGERIWLAPFLKGTQFAESLQKNGYSTLFPEIVQKEEYPLDAQLNLCPVGSNLIYGKKTAAREIVNNLTYEHGFRRVPVRQGYCRCACIPVDGESLITADRGIAAAAKANGLQVLLIAAGYVELSGYACGFIGGASFAKDQNTLVFTGDLCRHPDGDAILRFLAQRGKRAICLTSGPLLDIGGAFVLA